MSATTLSFDDAWYRLDQSWLADDMRATICKVIIRLPENVQEFAIENCTFLDFGNSDLGLCVEAPTFTHRTRRGRTMNNHWAILLNPSILKRESNALFTVAHEIAHAWLKHRTLSPELLNEEEADTLVKKWGFKIPKYRQKVHAEHRQAWERSQPRSPKRREVMSSAQESESIRCPAE